MLRDKLPALVLVSSLISSCGMHKSFITPGMDPITVKTKGEVDASFAMRPRGFWSVSVTGAVSNRLAIRLGHSGFTRLNNINTALLGFKSWKRYTFYFGPTYNYQRNLLYHPWSIPVLDNSGREEFNSEFHSPGLYSALSINLGGKAAVQILARPSYNIVQRFSYFSSTTITSAANHDNSTFYEENLRNLPLRNFFSLDLAFSVMLGFRQGGHFFFSLGWSMVQHVHEQNQVVLSRNSNVTTSSIQKSLNPKVLPFNLSVGFNVPIREGKVNKD
jgi:hypothetical protein